MNRERPKTGIVVAVPDLSGPIEQALRQYNDKNPCQPADGLSFSEVGYVETKAGVYAFSIEGVGPAEPVTKQNAFHVEFYATGDKWSSAIPDGAIVLTDREISALPVRKRVPLEEFIRQFGSRLEMNFGDWYLQISRSVPVPSGAAS